MRVQHHQYSYSKYRLTQYSSKYFGWRWALLCVRLYLWTWNVLYSLAYFVPFLSPVSLRALVAQPFFMFYKQCPIDGTPADILYSCVHCRSAPTVQFIASPLLLISCSSFVSFLSLFVLRRAI